MFWANEMLQPESPISQSSVCRTFWVLVRLPLPSRSHQVCTFLFQSNVARRPAIGDVQRDVFRKTLLKELEEIDRFYLLQDQSCFYLFKGPVTGERIEH